MQSAKRLVSAGKFLGITTVLICWSLAFPAPASAQGTQGQNAVYNGPSCCVGTNAFIDASMFAGNVPSPNFCKVLNYILVNVDQPPAYPSGAVIDARGLPGTTGTSMTCSASPWALITSPPKATILLPTGTIVIPTAGGPDNGFPLL